MYINIISSFFGLQKYPSACNVDSGNVIKKYKNKFLVHISKGLRFPGGRSRLPGAEGILGEGCQHPTPSLVAHL